MNYYLVNTELYHHGVLGQKWGVRRYQNADGSLTAAGKKREARLESKVLDYSTKSYAYAKNAETLAKQRRNGTSSLEKSDRYLKKAQKAGSKSLTSSAQKYNEYNDALDYNKAVAGEHYIKRKTSERVATAVTTAVVSAGIAAVAVSAGCPVVAVYSTTGGKYRLNNKNSGN